MSKQKSLLPTILFFGALLVPLFFLPLTIEYYETAKIFLLAVLSVVLFGVWACKVFKEKKLVIQKHYLLIPLLVFLAGVVASYIFSQDRVLSLFGYYGRFINSLPFYVVLIALFVGLVNTIKTEYGFRKLLLGLIVGLDVLGLLIVVQHFGVFSSIYPEGWGFLLNSNFNTLGTSVLVPLICVLNIPLASYLFSSLEDRKSVYVGLGSLSISTFVFALSAGAPFAGQNWIYYAFLLAVLAATYFFNPDLLKTRKIYSLVLITSLLFSIAVVNVNPFKQALGLDINPYVRESVIGFSYGWEILGGTLASSPMRALFGSGPDTFIEDFARYKPLEYNSTILWGVRFSRGASEFIEMVTNLGLVTFMSFLLVLYYAVKLVFKNRSSEGLYAVESAALSAVLLALILLGFIFVYDVVIWFILIVALVGLVLMDRLRKMEDSETVLSLRVLKNMGVEADLLPRIFVGVVAIAGVFTLFFFSRSYISDVYYRNSIMEASEGEVEAALDNAIQAIRFSDRKDYPHRQVAVQSLAMLEKVSSEDEPNENTQAAFLNQTIRENELMLSLAPNNVENWETSSIIYQRLINLTDGQYVNQAVESLMSAIRLDPLKPQLYEALGILYARAEEFDTARQQIEYAINLQPGYFRTYLSLSELFEMQKDVENAIKALEAAQSLLPADSEIVSLIDEKIQQLKEGAETESLTEGLEEDALTEPAVGAVEEAEEESVGESVEEELEE